MKTKYPTNIILFSFYCLLLTACAQIGQVEGGEKDTIPPSWLKSTPPNYSLNFAKKKVQLHFNEYLMLNGVDSKFVISPPLKEKPEVKLSGKKVVVKLKEQLQANTTYTLQFADAIADYTEKNPTENLYYVFSTGNTLDSLLVGGTVYDGETLEPKEGAVVMLYNNANDSTPYIEQPTYLAKTDTSGRFLVPNIHLDSYKIIALTDDNRNYLFDLPSESIAFLDSAIVPHAELYYPNDTVKQPSVLFSPYNLQLYLFNEEHRVPMLTERSWTNRRKAQILFTRNLDKDLFIEPLDSAFNKNWYQAEFSAENDTVSLWTTDTTIVHTDTLGLTVTYSTWDSLEQPIRRTDTVFLNFTAPKEPDSLFFTALKTNLGKGKLDLKDSIYLISDEPIAKIDAQRIQLYELRDTTVADLHQQKLLRYQRQRPDSLTFWFSETLPEKPLFNTPGKHTNWYTTQLDASRKKASVHLTDTSVINKDSIPLEVVFAGRFFNNAVLQNHKTLKIAYAPQRVLRAERLTHEHCAFWLAKWGEYSFALTDTSIANWLKNSTQEIVNDSLRVDIWVNAQAAQLNNILLNVQAKDQTVAGSDTLLQLQIGFIKQKQALVSYARPDSASFELQFQLPLLKEPELKPQNFRSFKIWFNGQLSTDRKRYRATLLDKNNIAQDSLIAQLSFSYRDSLAQERIAEQPITLIIGQRDTLQHAQRPTPKLAPETPQSVVKKTEETISIKTKSWNKVPFALKQDTAQARKYWLTAALKPDRNYLMLVDSFLVTNHWNMGNDSTRFAFSVKTEDDYGTLLLTLKNCPPNAYLQVMDAKAEKIIRQIGRVQDGLTTIPLLLPGDYQLRIFDDRNNNARWDNGNYLQHKLPESMRRYLTIFPIKAGWKTEEDWDLTDAEQSFGPPTTSKNRKKK